MFWKCNFNCTFCQCTMTNFTATSATGVSFGELGDRWREAVGLGAEHDDDALREAAGELSRIFLAKWERHGADFSPEGVMLDAVDATLGALTGIARARRLQW